MVVRIVTFVGSKSDILSPIKSIGQNGLDCSILYYLKKKLPGGMPLDPHSSLFCSAPLMLVATGPLQSERLEPPVGRRAGLDSPASQGAQRDLYIYEKKGH